MSLPQRSFNIRLPTELADSLDGLAQAIPGLKKGTIVRALLAESLHDRSLDEQVKVVVSQLQQQSRLLPAPERRLPP